MIINDKAEPDKLNTDIGLYENSRVIMTGENGTLERILSEENVIKSVDMQTVRNDSENLINTLKKGKADSNMDDIDVYNIYAKRHMYRLNTLEIDGADIMESGNKNQPVEVYIPEGAKVIKEGAFRNCNNIISINLPESLERIEEGAFSGCGNLRKINIPDKVKIIGRGAFQGCHMLRKIDIPEKATCVTYGCFNSCGIAGTLTIPDNIRIISVGAFKNCTLIKNVKLGKNTDMLRTEAFANCRALESIEIPDGMETFEEGVFEGCTSLKRIHIPKGVYTVASKVFKLCTSLETADIEEGVVDLASEAFYGCTSLKSIKVPGSVCRIEQRAFYGCSSLERVSFGDGIRIIKDLAFAECSSMQEAILPESIEELGENIFSGCTALKRVVLPKRFGTFDWRIKLGIPSECRVMILNCNNNGNAEGKMSDNSDGGVESVLEAIMKAGIGSVSVPDGIETIPSGAFCDIFDSDFGKAERKYYAEQIREIIIPSSVRNIAEDAFSGCISLESIRVDKDNKFYSSVDGVLMSKDEKTLIKYPENRRCRKVSDGKEAIDIYQVPVNTKYIAPHAFDLAQIEAIEISGGVEEIGEMAFHLCENLKMVNIKGVKKIGRMAFLDCRELTYANLGLCNATSIPEYLFSGCSKLGRLLLPARMESIERYAFWKCSSLKSIVFPSTVRFLADNSLCVGDGGSICVTLPDCFLQDRDKILRAGLSPDCVVFSSTSVGRVPVKVSELKSCYGVKRRPYEVDVNCLSGAIQRIIGNGNNLHK